METQNEVLPIFLLDNIVKKRCRNRNNLVQIKTCNANVTKQTQETLPSFYLLNARSLIPKVDELTGLIYIKPVDIVAVTESWLPNEIENRLLQLNNYNLFRKDRTTGRGGGVCAYVKKDIPCIHWLNFEKNRFECLWLCLRPRRLPRPLSGIVIAVIYHPPCLPVKEHDELNEYLINTADPDHGLILMGDFNDFETGILMSSLNVKQVVEKPTRGAAILDLITNLYQLYQSPHILAP